MNLDAYDISPNTQWPIPMQGISTYEPIPGLQLGLLLHLPLHGVRLQLREGLLHRHEARDELVVLVRGLGGVGLGGHQGSDGGIGGVPGQGTAVLVLDKLRYLRTIHIKLIRF